jgi:hypothetical protein
VSFFVYEFDQQVNLAQSDVWRKGLHSRWLLVDASRRAGLSGFTLAARVTKPAAGISQNHYSSTLTRQHKLSKRILKRETR